jgi:hypothetical protein
MEHGVAAAEAAAMKRRAAPTKASSPAAETASTATMATAAMPAADFCRQPFRDVFCNRRRARIDQRKRFSALARCRRQHQHRGSRKAQATNNATDQAAPGIWNLDHA